MSAQSKVHIHFTVALVYISLVFALTCEHMWNTDFDVSLNRCCGKHQLRGSDLDAASSNMSRMFSSPSENML